VAKIIVLYREEISKYGILDKIRKTRRAEAPWRNPPSPQNDHEEKNKHRK